MSLLVALIVGVLIGWAGQFMLQKELDTLLLSVLAGVVGSILGLLAYFVLAPYRATSSLFSAPGTLCSVIGAMICVLLFSGLHTFMEKHTAKKVDDTEENSEEEE